MQNIKNFFIAFLVSAIVFSAAAWFLMQKVIEIQEDTIVDEGNNPVGEIAGTTVNEVVEEISGETFTALLACTDSLTKRHDALMLVHVVKERKQYMITSLPSYMVLNIDSIEYYLGDLINEKGRSFLLDKVYAVTGLKIDYYAFVSLNGFTELIDEIGGVSFTVPQNMYYEDHTGKVLVDLKKGTQKLNGLSSLQLLRYKGYSNGDDERRNVQRDFIFTVLDSILLPSNIASAPAVFDKISKYTETNFKAEDFVKNIDLIFRYNSFEKIELDYPGVSNDSEGTTRFIPKIDEAIEMFKNHR